MGGIESGSQLDDGCRPGLRGHDDLRQQRIVVGRDFRAALHPRFGSGVRGKLCFCQKSRGRLKILARIFRIDAYLNGMTMRRRLDMGKLRHLAGSKEEHPADHVDRRHFLADAVLDLQPGVDLQKIEFIRFGVIHELHGSG